MGQLKTDLPRNAQWLKMIFEGLIALGGIVSLIFTCSTLKEVKRQRIKLYEPELRINSAPFNMICKIRLRDSLGIYFTLLTYNENFDSSLLIYPTNIITHKKIDDWETWGDQANVFSLPIVNVGHGVALDVTIKYSIDTNYFLDLFNKYSKLMVLIDSAFIKKGHFILTQGSDTTDYYDFNTTKDLQFIPDISSTSESYGIHLPSTYFRLMPIDLNYYFTEILLKIFIRKNYQNLFKKSLILVHQL
jgi:hypothetical protein